MRYAIFGDIHSNLEALEAVLADADAHGVGSYLCLGDIVGYNADPAACLETVRGLNGAVIKGNHDEYACESDDLTNMNDVAAAGMRWTRDQLNDEQKTWLRSLLLVKQMDGITVVHSSLDQPATWSYVLNRYDAIASFNFQVSNLCFHGHTHVPRVFVKNEQIQEIGDSHFSILPENQYFINVGSVGQPRDGDWRACYAIYDSESQEVVIRHVEYDLITCQHKIIACGLPRYLAERLALGK